MKVSNFKFVRERRIDQFFMRTYATIDIETRPWFRLKKETVDIFKEGERGTWRYLKDGSILDYWIQEWIDSIPARKEKEDV